MICAIKSTPFLYTNRDTITIVTKILILIRALHRKTEALFAYCEILIFDLDLE